MLSQIVARNTQCQGVQCGSLPQRRDGVALSDAHIIEPEVQVQRVQPQMPLQRPQGPESVPQAVAVQIQCQGPQRQ